MAQKIDDLVLMLEQLQNIATEKISELDGEVRRVTQERDLAYRERDRALANYKTLAQDANKGNKAIRNSENKIYELEGSLDVLQNKHDALAREYSSYRGSESARFTALESENYVLRLKLDTLTQVLSNSEQVGYIHHFYPCDEQLELSFSIDQRESAQVVITAPREIPTSTIEPLSTITSQYNGAQRVPAGATIGSASISAIQSGVEPIGTPVVEPIKPARVLQEVLPPVSTPLAVVPSRVVTIAEPVVATDGEMHSAAGELSIPATQLGGAGANLADATVTPHLAQTVYDPSKPGNRKDILSVAPVDAEFLDGPTQCAVPTSSQDQSGIHKRSRKVIKLIIGGAALAFAGFAAYSIYQSLYPEQLEEENQVDTSNKLQSKLEIMTSNGNTPELISAPSSLSILQSPSFFRDLDSPLYNPNMMVIPPFKLEESYLFRLHRTASSISASLIDEIKLFKDNIGNYFTDYLTKDIERDAGKLPGTIIYASPGSSAAVPSAPGSVPIENDLRNLSNSRNLSDLSMPTLERRLAMRVPDASQIGKQKVSGAKPSINVNKVPPKVESHKDLACGYKTTSPEFTPPSGWSSYGCIFVDLASDKTKCVADAAYMPSAAMLATILESENVKLSNCSGGRQCCPKPKPVPSAPASTKAPTSEPAIIEASGSTLENK